MRIFGLFLIISAIVSLIAVATYFISKYLRTKRIGQVGESQVGHVLRQVCGKDNVIHNYVITDEGKSSQIDYIVVNESGVIVIEVKNYGGHIYGSSKQQQWTQVLAHGKEKNTFYNPIKQNATHIYRLRKLLGDVPFFSLVVFTSRSVLHVDSDDVIQVEELKQRLQDLPYALHELKVREIIETLENNRSDISNKEHVENIRLQQEQLRQGICPRCGAQLVLRHSKYGDFWGCSQYPNCKFTKK